LGLTLWKGYDSADSFKKEVSIARSVLKTEEGQILRVGVGFLVWLLEKDPSKAEALISLALENRVQAIWLSFGQDIGRWVRYVREHDPRAGSKDAVKLFIQLSTVQELKVAITEWNADVIVVQGLCHFKKYQSCFVDFSFHFTSQVMKLVGTGSMLASPF
jgi:nitronate monooxygenase